MDLALKILLAALAASAAVIKQHFDDKEHEEAAKKMKEEQEKINAENTKLTDEINAGVSDSRSSELLSEKL